MCCAWQQKDTKNVQGRGNKLLRQLIPLSDVKEEVYAALDAWAAWDSVFPLLAIKAALH